MSDVGFIAASYAAVAGVLGLYVARVLLRGRQLSRRVPEERRRWL